MNREDKQTIRLDIAYDGTDFSGWQVQPNAVCIQEKIEEALKIILRQPVHLIGSGRTDAGVHATGQVAHFRIEQEVELARLNHALNGILPETIRILNVQKVRSDFHARYSATGKVYHYHLTLGPVANPFMRHYSWRIFEDLDRALLDAAREIFIGTHDFSSFANEAHKGSAARNAIRTLYRIDRVEEEGGLRLEFEGNGFLYKMVRNLVGTLVAVAKGKCSVDDVQRILKAKDRKLAPQAAPPQGLFLVKVHYPL